MMDPYDYSPPPKNPGKSGARKEVERRAMEESMQPIPEMDIVFQALANIEEALFKTSETPLSAIRLDIQQLHHFVMEQGKSIGDFAKRFESFEESQEHTARQLLEIRKLLLPVDSPRPTRKKPTAKKTGRKK